MRGLYLITNDDELALLLKKLQVALATGHIALLQYRRKKVDKITQYTEIKQILPLCQQYNVPLIINDDIEQAQQFGLGVHLGQDDGEIQTARHQLSSHIIGRTCMNSLDLAQQAVDDGADYIAFGAIYTSTSKQTYASNIGIDIIRQAKQIFPKTPICAIGGLTVENAQGVIQAGADMCAVISDVLGLKIEDIPQRIEAWATLFSTNDVLMLN